MHDSHSTGEPSFLLGTRRERRRWRSQRNGLPRGCVLAPLLFNVYTNDQPIHPGTRSFVYADDLAVTTQSTDFAPIEETLTSALDGLSEYYTTNQLRANPTKTQVKCYCSLHCLCISHGVRWLQQGHQDMSKLVTLLPRNFTSHHTIVLGRPEPDVRSRVPP